MKTYQCIHHYGHLHAEFDLTRRRRILRSDWLKTLQHLDPLHSPELNLLPQQIRTSYMSPSKNERIVSLAQLTTRDQYSPSHSKACRFHPMRLQCLPSNQRTTVFLTPLPSSPCRCPSSER